MTREKTIKNKIHNFYFIIVYDQFNTAPNGNTKGNRNTQNKK